MAKKDIPGMLVVEKILGIVAVLLAVLVVVMVAVPSVEAATVLRRRIEAGMVVVAEGLTLTTVKGAVGDWVG